MPRQKVEIPKRILSVVDRARSCGYVIKSMPTFRTGEEVARWSYADGSDAQDISVRQAIERGLLIPAGDGLFGSDLSQTYRAA